jgi:hypothetical protein
MAVADFLQDAFLDMDSGYAQARPACSYHTHPARQRWRKERRGGSVHGATSAVIAPAGGANSRLGAREGLEPNQRLTARVT